MTRWRSVEGELPGPDEPVWAAMPDGSLRILVRVFLHEAEGFVWADTLGGVTFDSPWGQSKWVANTFEWDGEYEPTHWMPLPVPEPPR